jgi:NAD(P)-dependent dehydrogenase (short-subunit alcohol dehydrogenase family)
MGYSVSKAAALHLMKHLALSVGPKIRVNAVLPGLMLTEWVSAIAIDVQTFFWY